MKKPKDPKSKTKGHQKILRPGDPKIVEALYRPNWPRRAAPQQNGRFPNLFRETPNLAGRFCCYLKSQGQRIS
jgi:hypothetical protein